MPLEGTFRCLVLPLNLVDIRGYVKRFIPLGLLCFPPGDGVQRQLVMDGFRYLSKVTSDSHNKAPHLFGGRGVDRGDPAGVGSDGLEDRP